jgi:hypothetical protein
VSAAETTPGDECLSCPVVAEARECAESKRPCGHHCNCSWTQDECCWCGEKFGEVKT